VLTVPFGLVVAAFLVLAAVLVALPIVGQGGLTASAIVPLVIAAVVAVVVVVASVVGGVVLRLWLILATLLVMLDDRGVGDALRGALQLVRRDPGPILITWVMAGAIGWLVDIVLAVPFMIASVLALGMLSVGGLPATILSVLLFGAPAFAVIAVVGTLYETGRHAGWTLLYRELETRATDRRPDSTGPESPPEATAESTPAESS
jgi:hypothetical protein